MAGWLPATYIQSLSLIGSCTFHPIYIPLCFLGFEVFGGFPLYHAVSMFVIFTFKVLCFSATPLFPSIYYATNSLADLVLLGPPAAAILSFNQNLFYMLLWIQELWNHLVSQVTLELYYQHLKILIVTFTPIIYSVYIHCTVWRNSFYKTARTKCHSVLGSCLCHIVLVMYPCYPPSAPWWKISMKVQDKNISTLWQNNPEV